MPSMPAAISGLPLTDLKAAVVGGGMGGEGGEVVATAAGGGHRDLKERPP